MTNNIIQMPTPMNVLADRIREARLTSAGKTTPQSTESVESIETSAAATKSDEQPPEKTPEQGPPKLTSRSPLLHMPRGEELTAVFLGKKARTMLGKLYHQHGGKQIITLVLEALDAEMSLVESLAQIAEASVSSPFRFRRWIGRPFAFRFRCQLHQL